MIYSCTVLDGGTRQKLTAKISDEVQIHGASRRQHHCPRRSCPRLISAAESSGKSQSHALLDCITSTVRDERRCCLSRLWDSIQLQSIKFSSIVSFLEVSSQRLAILWVQFNAWSDFWAFFLRAPLLLQSRLGVCSWFSPLVSCCHLFGVSSPEGCKMLIYSVMTSSFQTASPLSVPVRFCTELVSTGKVVAIRRPTGFQATSCSRRACWTFPQRSSLTEARFTDFR